MPSRADDLASLKKKKCDSGDLAESAFLHNEVTANHNFGSCVKLNKVKFISLLI